jgi:hypothetical protein
MCQTVHFDCFKTDLTGEKMQKFLHQLNMILPTDVRVSHLQLAPELQVFQIFAPILRRSFLAIAAAPGPPARVCFVARGGEGTKLPGLYAREVVDSLPAAARPRLGLTVWGWSAVCGALAGNQGVACHLFCSGQTILLPVDLTPTNVRLLPILDSSQSETPPNATVTPSRLQRARMPSGLPCAFLQPEPAAPCVKACGDVLPTGMSAWQHLFGRRLGPIGSDNAVSRV